MRFLGIGSRKQPQKPEADKYGYDFNANRPWDDRGRGYTPDSAGAKSVAVAAWLVGIFFAGVAAWLAIWVFWLHT